MSKSPLSVSPSSIMKETTVNRWLHSELSSSSARLTYLMLSIWFVALVGKLSCRRWGLAGWYRHTRIVPISGSGQFSLLPSVGRLRSAHTFSHQQWSSSHWSTFCAMMMDYGWWCRPETHRLTWPNLWMLAASAVDCTDHGMKKGDKMLYY